MRLSLILTAVSAPLLTACARTSGPTTASLSTAIKAAPPAVAVPASAAVPYDGVGSKARCGQRHLDYQAGKIPEATLQEKTARDMECTVPQ
jgi:hypothetical protein